MEKRRKNFVLSEKLFSSVQEYIDDINNSNDDVTQMVNSLS